MRFFPLHAFPLPLAMLAANPCPTDKGPRDTDSGNNPVVDDTGGGGDPDHDSEEDEESYACEPNIDFLQVNLEVIGQSGGQDYIEVSGKYECGSVEIETRLCADVGSEGMSLIGDGDDMTDGGGRYLIEASIGDLDDILDSDEEVDACVTLWDEDGEQLRIYFGLSSDLNESYDEEDWDWDADCPC